MKVLVTGAAGFIGMHLALRLKRDGTEVTDQSIEENRAFLCHCKQSGDSEIRGLFGLHASFTLSDKTLARCTALAGELDAGFHVHTAEALEDLTQCQRQHGRRGLEEARAVDIVSGSRHSDADGPWTAS